MRAAADAAERFGGDVRSCGLALIGSRAALYPDDLLIERGQAGRPRRAVGIASLGRIPVFDLPSRPPRVYRYQAQQYLRIDTIMYRHGNGQRRRFRVWPGGRSSAVSERRYATVARRSGSARSRLLMRPRYTPMWSAGSNAANTTPRFPSWSYWLSRCAWLSRS